MNDSRFAHSGSQTERNASTSAHEIDALRAATFILIATISAVAKGRTATKTGRDKSADQKSGFENPLPTGSARTIGIARLTTRIRKVLAGPFRAFQDSGTTPTSNRTPIKSGNTKPERRHSNQD